jgi:hypothetical protein
MKNSVHEVYSGYFFFAYFGGKKILLLQVNTNRFYLSQEKSNVGVLSGKFEHSGRRVRALVQKVHNIH